MFNGQIYPFVHFWKIFINFKKLVFIKKRKMTKLNLNCNDVVILVFPWGSGFYSCQQMWWRHSVLCIPRSFTCTRFRSFTCMSFERLVLWFRSFRHYFATLTSLQKEFTHIEETSCLCTTRFERLLIPYIRWVSGLVTPQCNVMYLLSLL